MIDAPDGTPLANSKVAVRSKEMGIVFGSFYVDTTSTNGSLTLDELPGKYVIGAIINGKTYEADVTITRKPHKRPTTVRLAATASGQSKDSSSSQ